MSICTAVPRAAFLTALLPLLFFTAPVVALDVDRDDVRVFIVEMRDQHGFDVEQLEALFSKVDSKSRIIELISKPAEKTLAWHQYRQIFLGEKRIAEGAEFYTEHEASLKDASDEYGVEPEIIAAIIGVETYYGARPGKDRVIDALSTLAFDYPPRQTFFRKELAHYLVLTRGQGIDPLEPTGSYAGAMGMPQFMPSSYLSYAEDGNDDGLVDIWAEVADVTASIAHYLQRHGWKPGMDVVVPAVVPDKISDQFAGNALKLDETVASLRKQGVEFETGCPDDTPTVLIRLEDEDESKFFVGFENFYAITRYNRSRLYAMAVIELSVEIDARRASE